MLLLLLSGLDRQGMYFTVGTVIGSVSREGFSYKKARQPLYT